MFHLLRRGAIAKLAAVFLAAVTGSLHATTLRVANVGDASSMDPHSLAEAFQLSFLSNIYEPLIGRDKDMSLQPLLATHWTQVSPIVWRFGLRKGVKFHDGTPFDADDVVFSFERAASEGSDMKVATGRLKQVRKVDEFTVDVETTLPFPILPETLTGMVIMSRKWCEQNRAVKPVDRRNAVENPANFKANGTGPYRLIERHPGTRTVLARHSDYWANVEGNVDEVIFTPIGNDAARVAALLSGAVDLMEPVPLQDVERIKSSRNLTVLQGPELRTIFLGMDEERNELLFSNVKGRNPFKDRRVRQAFYLAIDEEAIRTRIMRNAATPTAEMVAPGVRGFQADMNKRLPYDPDGARRLLTEAGYPNGFEVAMNCPNDRYVGDSAICQAVAANLARIGVKIDVRSESKITYFPRILRRETSFFLLGWTPSTVDAHDVMYSLMATPGDKGQGHVNHGSYSNPKIDELTAKVQLELNDQKRNEYIREAFRIHQEDIGHIPLHQQMLAWGFDKRISAVQLPNNWMFFKWIVVNEAQPQSGGGQK